MSELSNVYLYGEVGIDVDASFIRAAIDESPDGIDLRINSGGGEVFEGQAIYSLLNQYKVKTGNPVRVFIDSLAASIASVIAMAGDEIIMAENALLMIHNPWTWGGGTSKELRETANVLDKVRDTLITVYETRTGLSRDTIGALMDEETWFNAKEAVEMGFAIPSSARHKWLRQALKRLATITHLTNCLQHNSPSARNSERNWHHTDATGQRYTCDA